jgi:hypothetical protein
MIMSPARLGPENDCTGEDQQQLYDSPVLSSERGVGHQRTRKCLTVTKIWCWAPNLELYTKSGRLSVGHNVTLTLTLTCCSKRTAAVQSL